MNAGAYREKIAIEKCTITADEIGNHKSTWAEYYTGYAYVNMLSGSEYWAAAQLNAEQTVQFTLRYHRLLDGMDSTNYRIIFRGDTYNITSVDNVRYKNETIKLRGVK